MAQYEPFLQCELETQDDLEAHLAAADHNHLRPLCDSFRTYQKIHLLLHLAGQDNTPEHDESLERMDELEDLIRRGFQGIWN
jgi:hypothetical protein